MSSIGHKFIAFNAIFAEYVGQGYKCDKNVAQHERVKMQIRLDSLIEQKLTYFANELQTTKTDRATNRQF